MKRRILKRRRDGKKQHYWVGKKPKKAKRRSKESLMKMWREQQEKQRKEKEEAEAKKKSEFASQFDVDVKSLIRESAELQRQPQTDESKRERLRDITLQLKDRKKSKDPIIIDVAYETGEDIDFLESMKDSFIQNNMLGEGKYNKENFSDWLDLVHEVTSFQPDYAEGQRLANKLGSKESFRNMVKRFKRIG